MNLRQLEVFQAVMQTGTMSAAAQLVCITPSAVSKTISHTEIQLGYSLFTRVKGGLVPTPEAMVLYGESAAIHHKLDELHKTAANLRRIDRGQVRLAAIPSISHEFLPAALALHAHRYPGVNVEVRTLHRDQMVQALLTRSVDFALGYYEHPHPQIASRMLVSGPFYAAVMHDIWERLVRARRSNPMEFLASTPLIRLVGDDPMRGAIDQLADRLGVGSESLMQVQTTRLALELVRRGMGWTVIDFITARNLHPRTIFTVELQDLPAIPLYAYHAPASPLPQPAVRMLDLLRQELGVVLARGPGTAS